MCSYSEYIPQGHPLSICPPLLPTLLGTLSLSPALSFYLVHGVSGIPVFQWEGPSGVTLPSPSSITRLTNIEQNVSTHLIFKYLRVDNITAMSLLMIIAIMIIIIFIFKVSLIDLFLTKFNMIHVSTLSASVSTPVITANVTDTHHSFCLVTILSLHCYSLISLQVLPGLSITQS